MEENTFHQSHNIYLEQIIQKYYYKELQLVMEKQILIINLEFILNFYYKIKK